MTNPIERARERVLSELLDHHPVNREHHLNTLKKYERAIAEEGLCIVPEEPTEEMRIAGTYAYLDVESGMRIGSVAEETWKDMLAAALNSKEKEPKIGGPNSRGPLGLD